MFDARCLTRGVWRGIWRVVSDVVTRGIWRAVFNARCLTHGISRAVFDAQCFTRGIWRTIFDARCLVRGIWRAVFDARCLVRGIWRALFDARCLTRGVWFRDGFDTNLSRAPPGSRRINNQSHAAKYLQTMGQYSPQWRDEQTNQTNTRNLWRHNAGPASQTLGQRCAVTGSTSYIDYILHHDGGGGGRPRRAGELGGTAWSVTKSNWPTLTNHCYFSPGESMDEMGHELPQWLKVWATDWPRTKSRDISLDGHIQGLPSNYQVKIRFFRISNISVTCPHAQLTTRAVIKTLGTFFGPWGRDRSQSPPCWFFRVKQIQQSRASERTTRLDYEDI